MGSDPNCMNMAASIEQAGGMSLEGNVFWQIVCKRETAPVMFILLDPAEFVERYLCSPSGIKKIVPCVLAR